MPSQSSYAGSLLGLCSPRRGHPTTSRATFCAKPSLDRPVSLEHQSLPSLDLIFHLVARQHIQTNERNATSQIAHGGTRAQATTWPDTKCLTKRAPFTLAIALFIKRAGPASSIADEEPGPPRLTARPGEARDAPPGPCRP